MATGVKRWGLASGSSGPGGAHSVSWMRLCRWAVCAAVAPGALTGGEAVGSIPEWRTLERAHYVIMVLYVNPHAPLCARGAEIRAPLSVGQFLMEFSTVIERAREDRMCVRNSYTIET